MSSSPLKSKPLRNPGHSLDREIDSWVSETLMGFYVAAALLTFLAAMEWVGYLNHSPRRPVLYSVCAGVALAAFAYKFVSIRRHVTNLKLGRDGERCVGQFLEGLRESGALVFHDIPAQEFNLDHVVVCSHGIFVIETKTRSKPFPDARVEFRNGKLTVAGRVPDRDPITQVVSAARWLDTLIKDSTGKSFKSRPVVVFPGWYVEQTGFPEGVWVMEPKMLPSAIAREQSALPAVDVKLVAFHLSRYIRSEVASVG